MTHILDSADNLQRKTSTTGMYQYVYTPLHYNFHLTLRHTAPHVIIIICDKASLKRK